jgi:outer membrane protein TolC
LQQTNVKHRAGLVSVDDVHQAEWTWAEAKKIQLESEEQVTTLRQNLAVLVGEAPQFGASIAIVPVDTLPPLPKALELNELGNRADIQAAKHRATAAAQDVKAARARFYPNISLSGSVGLSSIELSKLLDAGSWVATVVPAISLPIFSQTALNAQLSGQQAAYDAAVAVYNKTVIHAASEASLAVTRLNNAKQEQALIQDQASRASALAHTAESRYKAGLSDASSYQLAKRRALQQQMRLAMVKTDVLLAHTQLLRHLGATLN